MSHLHDNYSFTESLVETVIRSLRHSCRSELTRQGTSLETLLKQERLSGRHLRCRPCMSPCSRDHIFIRCLGVRRMVSEDSDQLLPGFLAVHRLSDLDDLDQTLAGQMMTAFDQLNAPCKSLEVLLLRGVHGMPAE